MMFREKSTSRLYAFALAAVFALTLAGCGGGGGGTADTTDPGTMPDPQMECEDAGGRWNADMTCTTAAELVMERQAAQRSAISTAIGTATTAVNAVDNDSTDAEVSAADTALANARSAIADAANLSAEEKAANSGTVDALATQLAGAKTARMEAMDAAEMAERMAMMATAMKLHAGISAPSGDVTSPSANDRAAGYNTAGTAIMVSVGDGTNTPTPATLSENKKAMVADHYGWQGKMYADPAGGDTYEAVVYSNVGDPTEGDPFNEEYTLDGTTGELAIDTSQAGVSGRVASQSFDQSAGKKEFKLPTNTVRVMISGSYHGVSGTYYCTPTSGETCSASVAESGFTLANGTWTFKPSNPEAKVMSSPDTIYASYGWWIKKSADGKTFTASAFVADRGDVPDASGITNLRGTATYMGGAAGKYALYSATGGTNDAGHFTARATLNADFNDDMITGTIDNFMGADGEARNWSVELKESAIGDTGTIVGDGTAGNTDMQMTVWTIDGTAAAASGGWQGSLQNNGDDNVPQVGTGTFTSTYSTSGQMVGAFGVNKQ